MRGIIYLTNLMAKKSAKPNKSLSTRRVVKNSRASRSIKRGNKSVPKAKGLDKLRPKHVWSVLTSKKALKIYGVIVAVFVLLLAGLFLWFAKDLPSPNKINSRVSAQTTKIYDRTGENLLIEVYGDKNRSIIEFDQMPKCIKDATVALEDKDFYKQGAFSPRGIARAFTGVVFKDPSRGGGSTITQQYVKNALLTNERTVERKIKELILSIQMEQLYKKDDILKLYLNEIPYGSTAYGIQAASKQFFGIDAKDLSLSQCVTLASLPQAPTYYSPYGSNKDELLIKKDRVLDLMSSQGYISKTEADEAKQVDVLAQLKPYNPYANVQAPHFVQYVREKLEEKYGIKRVNEGGFKVISTIDLPKQKIAEAVVKDNIKAVRSFGGSNAALVSSDPNTAEVLSMVGSYDTSDPEFGSFNVTTSLRQPGSSIKPLVYANMFKKNWGAGSTMYDVKTDFGGNPAYIPENYTKRFYGVQSVRTALASSLNIPAVKALYIGGIPEFIGTAKDMGITTYNRSTDNYGLSTALGAAEVRMVDMANAFSAFPTDGKHRDQVYWLKITDGSGKVVDDNSKQENNKAKQVLDPQIAYQINSIMSDNNARCSLGVFPCRNPLTLAGKTVAAKTGTSEDYRDAWTVGYTKRVVTVVWAGNNDNRPMTQAASIVSAPIWNQYMTKVTKDDPNEPFEKPSGIKDLTIDANTGKSLIQGSRTRTDIFPSWYRIEQARDAQKASIDIVSGKLATDCTPEGARREITGSLITAEIGPTDPSYPRWNPPVQTLARSLGYSQGGSIPSEKDDVHQCGDPQPVVSISASPSSGSTFTLSANTTSGKFPINQVEFYMDGNIIATQQGSGPGFSTTITPASGNHTFSAKVIDSGYYTATSNSVSVTATGSGGANLSCSGRNCSFTYTLGSFSAQLYVGGAPFGTAVGSSPYSWDIFPSTWNGASGASSNVKIIYSSSSGSQTIYP